MIAERIKAELDTWGKDAKQAREAIRSMTIALALQFQKENTRFDYFKFIEACGIEA